MIETLAPFYGIDPETEATLPGPPPRESAAWLRAALDGAEERIRDLEAELAGFQVEKFDDEAVVLTWLDVQAAEIDPEKKPALAWALGLVRAIIVPEEEP